MDGLSRALDAVQLELNGDPIPGRRNEATIPGIRGRVGQVIGGHWGTRQELTATQRSNMRIAQSAFDALNSRLIALLDGDLAQLEADLAEAGAPWTPGRTPIGRWVRRDDS